MDLKSVISKNVDEYLKPKYPIYRVKYIKSELIYEMDEQHLISNYCERICEFHKNKEGFCCTFDENESIIYDRVIEHFDKFKKKFWKDEVNECEQIIIIGFERLA